MRLCQRLLCDETATVYYRGAWCSLHSNLLGDRAAVEFRNAPALETAGSAVAPEGGPWGGGVRESNPSPDGTSPLSFDELEDILALEQSVETA